MPNQNPIPQAQVPQAVQPAFQSYPAPSVGAVNIQIYNPTANPVQGGYQQCYPCNYNNMTVPANQYMASKEIAPSQDQIQTSQGIDPNQMNLNNNQNGIAAQSNGENQPKTEEKKDKKPTIPLTDDYIKTLENYLNSQDSKIRLMGAQELLERFKEDETRKQDPALTALLNKVLQDPTETVKFVGLTALDTGYALGNNETAQILNQIQYSNSSYGADADLAAQTLLKMSGTQAQNSVQQAAPLNQPQPKNAVPETAPLNQAQTQNMVQ